MPSYDQPQLEWYIQPSSAFGATTESTQYFGPKGKKGRVLDIDVFVTATMVGTTTVPEIDVGTAQGTFEYARFRLGTAIGAGYAQTAPFRATNIGGNTTQDDSPAYEDYTGHVKLQTAPIPADTAFFISRVAGVGGAPAGTGPSRVLIAWF